MSLRKLPLGSVEQRTPFPELGSEGSTADTELVSEPPLHPKPAAFSPSRRLVGESKDGGKL